MIAWIKLHNFTAMKEKNRTTPPLIITGFNFCPPGTKVGSSGLVALIVRSVEHAKSLLFLSRTVRHTASIIKKYKIMSRF